jgi:hypothetical protein
MFRLDRLCNTEEATMIRDIIGLKKKAIVKDTMSSKRGVSGVFLSSNRGFPGEEATPVA